VQWLVDVAKGLIIVVFFVQVAQLLLPETGLRGYARLVMGLLVVVALLNPILTLLEGDLPVEPARWGLQSGNAETYLAAGQRLAAAAQERITGGARHRFTQQVASVTALAAGAEPDRVEVEWGPEGAPAVIRAVFGAGGRPVSDADRVRWVVAQFFGLAPEQVEIRITPF